MKKSFTPIFYSVLLCALTLTQSLLAKPTLTDHGTISPTATAGWYGIICTQDKDGTPLILVHLWEGSGQRSLLLINAITGDSEQFPLPGGNGAGGFSTFLTRERYFCTTIADRFVVFDLWERKWVFEEKAAKTMVLRFAEDNDGTVYFATYPGADLFRFDVDKKKLTTLGKAAKESWPQYPHLATDDKGWLYTGIMHNRVNLIATDTGSGKKRPLLNEAERDAVGHVRTLDMWRGADGGAYAVFQRSQRNQRQIYRLYEGKATVIKADALPQRVSHVSHPERDPKTFADGRKLQEISIPNRTAVLLDAQEAEPRTLQFDYQVQDGARVYTLIAHTDGNIYGATGFPARFFRFNPQTQTLEDWELPGFAWGHINDLSVMNGTIYGGHYSSGGLLGYDPTQPIKAGSNPQRLFSQSRMREVFGRPHAVLAHSDGRHVLMGGNPMRALTGGGLLIFDTAENTPEIIAAKDLLPDQGVMSLAQLADGNILVGGTTDPGTGGERKAANASLAILDLEQKKKIFELEIAGSARIDDLLRGEDGLIYGISTDNGSGNQQTFFVFDPVARKVARKTQIPSTHGGRAPGTLAPRVLLAGKGEKGRLYAVQRKAVVSIDPASLKIDSVLEAPAGKSFSAVIAGQGDRLYLTDGTNLLSFPMPE